MAERTFREQQNTAAVLRVRELLKSLPPWYADFIRASENTMAPSTILKYAFDTKLFLNYLLKENVKFADVPDTQSITVKMIDDLTLTELEMYVEYLTYYVDEDNHETTNGERGKARKISSLRAMFKHLYKKELIANNPADLLSVPKLHEKAKIRLEPDEVARLIDNIESGEGLTERQKAYQKKTVKRDIAIFTLFLTTGIRVSELIGINIRDVDFDNRSFKVMRKGGNEDILFFDDETDNALTAYIEERKAADTYSLDAPLFLSSQGKRINVRTVEKLVEKYARITSPLKKITPHKLRTTYGTMLYQETGDIYLVADVLGHKDVNTTRKHYADTEISQRRKAAKLIKLRDDET